MVICPASTWPKFCISTRSHVLARSFVCLAFPLCLHRDRQVCRREKTPHLLLDFSDLLHTLVAGDAVRSGRLVSGARAQLFLQLRTADLRAAEAEAETVAGGWEWEAALYPLVHPSHSSQVNQAARDSHDDHNLIFSYVN